MVIDVPNGANISQLKITEVLYFPEVGYTLVSVGQLDDCGFTVMFSSGKCKIIGPDGAHVGEFLKIGWLYCITHEVDRISTSILTACQPLLLRGRIWMMK